MPKSPSNCYVTLDGLVLNVFSSLAGMSAVLDTGGLPCPSTMSSTLEFSADLSDRQAVPFTTVRKLFQMCQLPAKDKIKDITVQLWTDENRTEPILSLAFRGWISSWTVSSGGGANHIFSFALQPELNASQSPNITIGT